MTHAAPDQDDIATDGTTLSTSPDASFPTPIGPAAARAVNLRKVYGSGDTQVAALDLSLIHI